MTLIPVDGSLNRLNRRHRLRVSGGEGVHVGEDKVTGAVVVEGDLAPDQDMPCRPCKRER